MKTSNTYGTTDGINPESSWEELTWWLDDNNVSLWYDYAEGKLKIDTTKCDLDEIPENVRAALKAKRSELKRFILETDQRAFERSWNDSPR